jgi:hypothetical protein
MNCPRTSIRAPNARSTERNCCSLKQFCVEPFELGLPATPEVQAAKDIAPSRSASVSKRLVSTRFRIRSRGVRWRVAASVAAGLLVAFTAWLGRPQDTLAAEVIRHIEGEPDSWSKTRPVPDDEISSILRQSGVNLGSGMGPIVYASCCPFRGQRVPHFVVKSGSNAVTVIILAHEHVARSRNFSLDGYSGMLLSAGGGGVAIVSRTPAALGESAGAVLRAVKVTHP